VTHALERTQREPAQLARRRAEPRPPNRVVDREGIVELQRHIGNRAVVRRLRSNTTGLPTPVLRGMEGLLGRDLSSVRVHADSPRAARLGAVAFTEGLDVHVAPGRLRPETAAGRRLLGHELAHVVQQADGRVPETTRADGLAVNDDAGLEREADAIGERAASAIGVLAPLSAAMPRVAALSRGRIVQRNHDSVPLDKFTSAVQVVSDYSWTAGTGERTIKVWNIAHEGNWDFHLSAILDPTGRHVTKFHFTLRRGPGKGTDAFAWFKISGQDRSATLGAREDAGQVNLFTAALPASVSAHVGNINTYAQSLFTKTKSFIK